MASKCVVFAVVVGLFGVVVGQNVGDKTGECLCREQDPSDNCPVIYSLGGDRCREEPKPCSGCVCDLSGTKNCDLVVGTNYNFLRADECELVQVVQTKCPPAGAPDATQPPTPATASPTPAPSVVRQVITASCSVEGIIPNDFQCEFDCFPENVGTLVNITLDYAATFTGSFNATNESPTTTATGIDVEQLISTAVYEIPPQNSNSVTYILPSDGGGIGVSFKTSPELRNEDIAPGQTISLNPVEGEKVDSGVPVDNQMAWYQCSSANGGDADTAIAIVFATSLTDAGGTILAQSSGFYRYTMTINYIFESVVVSGTVLPS